MSDQPANNNLIPHRVTDDDLALLNDLKSEMQIAFDRLVKAQDTIYTYLQVLEDNPAEVEQAYNHALYAERIAKEIATIAAQRHLQLAETIHNTEALADALTNQDRSHPLVNKIVEDAQEAHWDEVFDELVNDGYYISPEPFSDIYEGWIDENGEYLFDYSEAARLHTLTVAPDEYLNADEKRDFVAFVNDLINRAEQRQREENA